MPKVNQEYVAEKQRTIVDAAIRVCKSKPVYAVTLRDVVKECGISQGGLYHYFTDIDEIFAEILNRCFEENKVDESEYKIFESNKPLDEIIVTSYAILGQLMDKITNQYGSLIFELNSIYLNEPERGMKTINRIKSHSDMVAFHDKIFSLIEAHIANGDIELAISKEYLILLDNLTMQGIQQAVTFSQKSYDKENRDGVGNKYTTAKEMMVIWAHSINGLLHSKPKNNA